MPAMPEPPDEFESKEELRKYIDRLQEYLNALEDEQAEFNKTKREVKTELNEIENYLSTSSQELDHLHGELEAVIQRIENIDLHGKPSDVGLQDSLRNANFGGN